MTDPVGAKRPWHSLLVGIAICLHLALVLLLFRHVWSAVSPFDGLPFNGAFQTYNALRRIEAGERPGRDFVAFHGVGVPIVQYPYFKLLGGDFVASEITRTFLRRLQVIFVILLFSWLLRLGWVPSLVLWPLAIGTGVTSYFALPATTSLLEFRSMFPLLVAGVVLAPREVRWRPLWIGISCAFALLCGVEHGLAVVAAMGISTALASIFARGNPVARRVLSDVVWGLGIGVAVALLALLAIGGAAGVAATLKFYLVELPNDQFWYFGVPPNDMFVWQWKGQERFYAIAALAPLGFVLSWLASRRATTEVSYRLAVGLMVLFGYASVSLVSYLGIAQNVLPQARAVVAACVCVLVTLWNARFSPPAAHVPSRFAWRTAIFAGVAVSPFVITPLYRAQHELGYSQGYLDDFQAFEQATDIAPGDARATGVWSDYAGMIEDRLGVFQPHTDYLIHVLGPARRASYLETFAKVQPEYVITAHPEFEYTPWLWQSFWGFYRHVAVEYDPVVRTRYMQIWQRRPGERVSQSESPWIEATTKDDGASYSIDCPREAERIPLMEIKVTYVVENPWGAVPLVGKFPRLFVYPSHTLETLPFSLPPYQSEFVFPAIPSGEHDIELRYGVESIIPGATLEIESVQARVVAQLAPNHPLVIVEKNRSAE